MSEVVKSASGVQSPESIQPHEGDYRPEAWLEYTEEELSWWVLLLRKRAGMRTDPVKRDKDNYDANNYETMLRTIQTV